MVEPWNSSSRTVDACATRSSGPPVPLLASSESWLRRMFASNACCRSNMARCCCRFAAMRSSRLMAPCPPLAQGTARANRVFDPSTSTDERAAHPASRTNHNRREAGCGQLKLGMRATVIVSSPTILRLRLDGYALQLLPEQPTIDSHDAFGHPTVCPCLNRDRRTQAGACSCRKVVAVAKNRDAVAQGTLQVARCLEDVYPANRAALRQLQVVDYRSKLPDDIPSREPALISNIGCNGIHGSRCGAEASHQSVCSAAWGRICHSTYAYDVRGDGDEV